MKEIHNYIRHNFQLLVTWYTFFITLNFAAVGWFGSELMKGNLLKSHFIYSIAIYFIIQGILSLFGLQSAKRYLTEVSKKVEDVPVNLYNNVTTLFQITVVTLIILWIIIII